MQIGRGFWAGGLLALLAAPTYGSLSASATISSTQLGPSSYQYSLTLTNTGTTNIGTFWFGWIPGYDLLPHHPTSFFTPAGWTATDAPDFFGVASAQWVNTTAPLGPGGSLSGFGFDSPDSPTALAGTDSFGFPIKYSYVYIGAPETDPGFLLTPTTVAAPEPGIGLVLGLPAMMLLRRRRA